MNDLRALLKLEPANPAAIQLLAGLQAKQQDAVDTNALVDEVRSCSLVSDNTTASRKRMELAEAAEQAWKVLQEEESQMRQVFKVKKPPVAPRNKRKSPNTAAVAPTRRQNSNQQEHQQQQQPQADGSMFKSSINDLWESLAQEEQNTVAKVYQKRRSSTKSK